MKILFILPSYNIYGGTSKKTKDLMKYFGDNSCMYVYERRRLDLKGHFTNTGGKVFEGFHGRNIYKHFKALLKIVDDESINIIQTQFSMGETLGYLVKLFRPKVKLIIAFVGTNKPFYPRNLIVPIFYKKADHIIYVSQYAKEEKCNQFPSLLNKENSVIYNGTPKRENTGENTPILNKIAILSIANLVEWKNLGVLIDAMNELLNTRGHKDIQLYLVGDGPMKNTLHHLIKKKSLEKNVFLLGDQSNIGELLEKSDIFVHPCNVEAFGIAVAEAMMAEKPIIVSNAGALPELIQHNVSGLLVSQDDPKEWADSIIRIITDTGFSDSLGKNARKKALEDFSVEKFTNSYLRLYQKIIG